MKDLVTIGEILIDLTYSGRENNVPVYVANPGGAPANVAVAAKPLALVLGDDGRTGELSREFAGLLERAVVAAGVDHEDRFESLIGLCPEEGDAAFDVTGPVAYRDHHGNVELICSCVCLRIYGISPHGSFTEKGTSYRGRIRYLR